MKHIILFISLFYFSSCVKVSKKNTVAELKASYMNYDRDFDDKNVVVMITSLTCGYCVLNVPFFNKLKETYKQYEFIAFYEDAEEKILNSKWEKLNWKIVPNTDNGYTKFWRYEIYPEIQVYRKGKLTATIQGVNKKKIIKVLSAN